MQANLPSDIASAVQASWWSSQVAASQTAGTDVTDTYLGAVMRGQAIAEIWIVPISAGLTSSDTLAVTFSVGKKTAGGATVPLATVQTKTAGGGGSGSWTQIVPVKLAVVAGSTVAAQDVITVTTTHLSTGTATPSFEVYIVPVAS